MKKKWFRYLLLLFVLLLTVGMLAACGDDDDDDDDDDSGKKKKIDYVVNDEKLAVSEDMVPVGYWPWKDEEQGISCWYPGAATPGGRYGEYATFEAYGEYKIYIQTKTTKKVSELADAIDAAVKFAGKLDDNMDDEPDFESVDKKGDTEKTEFAGKTLYGQMLTAKKGGEEKSCFVAVEMYEDEYVIYFVTEEEEDAAGLAFQLIAGTVRLDIDAYKGIEGNSLGVPTPTGGAAPTDGPDVPTPTEEVTPTPTVEVTATPTPTPTEELTPTPTVTIAAPEFSTYEHPDMHFTIDFPVDSYIEKFDNGVCAETDDGFIYIAYRNMFDEGSVEDSADFFAIAGDDKDKMSELLYLDDISFLPGSEASEFDINGAKAATFPLATMVWDEEEDDFGRGCGRAYVINCKDAVGVYYAWYIVNDANYNSLTEAQKATIALFDSCIQSVKQKGSPINVDYKLYKDRMPDGAGYQFLYENGVIKSTEKDPNGYGYRFYFNDEKQGYLLIQHFTPAQKTIAEYFDAVKAGLNDPQYTFTSAKEHQGRLLYTNWTLSYKSGEYSLVEDTYVTMTEDGEMWYVLLFATEDGAEEQADFLDDVLWSLHEHFDY